MNERIKELAGEAQQYAEYVTPQGTEWFDTFKEKFAELIVKECIDLVSVSSDSQLFSNVAYDKGYGDGRNDSAFAIKQHFGVEEKTVCHHDWYSAKNPVVLNGSVCVKCGAIDPREPEELKNERTN
jgi:hypothetical protein